MRSRSESWLSPILNFFQTRSNTTRVTPSPPASSESFSEYEFGAMEHHPGHDQQKHRPGADGRQRRARRQGASEHERSVRVDDHRHRIPRHDLAEPSAY